MKKDKIKINKAQADKLSDLYKKGEYEAFNSSLAGISKKFYIEDIAEEIAHSAAALEHYRDTVESGVNEIITEVVSDPEELKKNRELAKNNSDYLGDNYDEFEFGAMTSFVKSDYKKLSTYSKEFGEGNNFAVLSMPNTVEYELDDAFYCRDEKEIAEKLLEIYDLNIDLTNEKEG